MSGEPPPEIRDLDRALRAVRFQPRSSLGPEIQGRIERGEPGESLDLRPGASRWRRRVFLGGGAALLASAVLALWSVGLTPPPFGQITLDRCCYDLDGGGTADDGVHVLAGRGERVRRIAIYEDLDQSGSLTRGDIVRFVRRGDALLRGPLPEGLVTFRTCCEDLDGGGPPDDGVLVVGVPPDRVVLAAIYESR